MSEQKVQTKKGQTYSLKEPKYEHLFIHLTLITELIKKENGETKCICNNIIIPQTPTQPQPEPTSNSTNTNTNESEPKENSIFLETEIIPSLSVPSLSDGRILLNDIASQLKNLGYPVTGALISIYINKVEDYVFIGAEPLDQNYYLDPKDVDMSCIKLKIVSYIEDK